MLNNLNVVHIFLSKNGRWDYSLLLKFIDFYALFVAVSKP